MAEVNVPALDTLLTDFAERRGVRRSDATPQDLREFEEAVGIVLPLDYRALLLRYDLRDVEFEFSRFAPPLSGNRQGVLGAIRQALQGAHDPFTDIYVERGVIPVGTDWAENYLVLAVQPPAPSAIERLGEAARKPEGTVWLFDHEGGFWDFEGGMSNFTFVASTFSHTLQIGLYLSSIREDITRERISHQETFDRLATIDPGIRGHDYWDGWIETLAND